MALCPFARQRLIPESNTQGRITPRVLIYHEAVSSADSLYNYWTSPGVELESHFYVYSDGSLDQYVDTNVRADANVDANGFAISVETWDDGGDTEGTWTDAQVATLTRLAAWCEQTHGIPAQVPATWDGSGIGWHNLFPGPWAGGPRTCPGRNRAAQVRNIIIPAVAAGYDWRAARPATGAPAEEAPEEEETVKETVPLPKSQKDTLVKFDVDPRKECAVVAKVAGASPEEIMYVVASFHWGSQKAGMDGNPVRPGSAPVRVTPGKPLSFNVPKGTVYGEFVYSTNFEGATLTVYS